MTYQSQMEEEIVGFRFHPTGYELVNHHLKRKLQKIDENRCMIPDVNIYDYNPQDLHAVYNGRLNPNSDRNKRQARGGYWKETGEKKYIEEEETGKTIGTKRILVFYSGKQGNAHATEWAMHEYHLNADAADSTITDQMAIALCHVKKKARNKKGNLKKQQSKKGNSKKQQSKHGNSKKQQSKKAGSPSYEADSSSHGIETQEKNFQEFSLLGGQENVLAQPEKGSPSVGVYSPEQFPMAEQLATVNHGFYNKHRYTHNMTYEQSNTNMQSGLENFGSNETSQNSTFIGQPSVESSVFGRLDYTARGTCHSEDNTLHNDDCEDGICLWEMDFWRDEQLMQEQIHNALS
ncbi:hypothetical protein CDL15_Pgr028464 [Punica granatum]|uniref:NAC domain-containing protein n=1 Tax=Punica granatum TaxID=22663 RepID=A0A218VW06_PUNGR|nr:hypothetical protein CDL15_Pgr028464 [Punica granatum]